jgi:hypothetical protein
MDTLSTIMSTLTPDQQADFKEKIALARKLDKEYNHEVVVTAVGLRVLTIFLPSELLGVVIDCIRHTAMSSLRGDDFRLALHDAIQAFTELDAVHKTDAKEREDGLPPSIKLG